MVTNSLFNLQLIGKTLGGGIESSVQGALAAFKNLPKAQFPIDVSYDIKVTYKGVVGYVPIK